MPLFFVHGFKWDRAAIRIFVILNNLEDASPDYLLAGLTSGLFRAALEKHNPGLLAACPNLTFIEQHDPDDLRMQAQPHAFVCDLVVEAKLSINVTEAMRGNLGAAAWDKMVDLRDQLAAGEEVGWFAVWNGDVERADVGEAASEGVLSNRHSSGGGNGGIVNGHGNGGRQHSPSGSASLGSTQVGDAMDMADAVTLVEDDGSQR